VRTLEVTLDTNVLWDYLRNRSGRQGEALAILQAHQAGNCDVAVTTRVLGDVRSPDQQIPRSEMQDGLNSLLSQYEISEIGTAFRLDVSCNDGMDVLVDVSWKESERRLLAQIWPCAQSGGKKHSSRLRDIDHLLGHRYNRRDVFVTRDKEILENRSILQREFGIDVASPTELVKRLRSLPR
jgi:hypothetical protein